MPLPQRREHVGEEKESRRTEHHITLLVGEVQPLGIADAKLDLRQARGGDLLQSALQ